jgi:hypothetical protein
MYYFTGCNTILQSQNLFLKVVGVIDLLALGPGPCVGVKSLCVHKSGLKVLVALSGDQYVIIYIFCAFTLFYVIFCNF